jgi:succinoglycan biosynthesis transport protein ExoP
MDLRKHLTLAWRGKWIIITVFLTTMIVIVILNNVITPVYAATATLRVLTISSGTGSDTRYDIDYADRLLETYVRIATSAPVIDELQQRLELDSPPKTEAKIIRSTELMTVSAQSGDPVHAAEAANVLAEILIEQSRAFYSAESQTASATLLERLDLLESETEQLQQDYEQVLFQTPEDTTRIDALRQSIDLKEELYGNLLTEYEDLRLRETMREQAVYVIEPASPPDSPMRPNTRLNLALGVIVGLLGGFGLALLVDNLDTRLHTTDQITALTGLPLLGAVPATHGKQELRRFDARFSPFAEEFRRLWARTLVQGSKGGRDIVLVTSAEPQEGKSTVAAHLAAAVARSAQDVVIIDADPYRPALHKIFDIPNEKGLTDLLTHTADLNEVLQPGPIPGLQVITSGTLSSESGETLDPVELDGLFQELTQHFDLVLVDTPAFLTMADATVIAPLVRGVVLVVGRGRVRRAALLAACDQLAALEAHILGVVVNRADQYAHNRYYSHSNNINDHVHQPGVSRPMADRT